MNMPLIECNRTDNDELKELTEYHFDIDTEDEMIMNSLEEKEDMNIPIIESNRTDNDLFAEYDDDDDDDFDFDSDTEDEMIEGKIDDAEIKDVIDKIDDAADDKIEGMIEEEQEHMIEDIKKEPCILIR